MKIYFFEEKKKRETNYLHTAFMFVFVFSLLVFRISGHSVSGCSSATKAIFRRLSFFFSFFFFSPLTPLWERADSKDGGDIEELEQIELKGKIHVAGISLKPNQLCYETATSLNLNLVPFSFDLDVSTVYSVLHFPQRKQTTTIKTLLVVFIASSCYPDLLLFLALPYW